MVDRKIATYVKIKKQLILAVNKNFKIFRFSWWNHAPRLE